MLTMKEAFERARVLIDESGRVAQEMLEDAEPPVSPEGDPPLEPEEPVNPIVPEPEGIQ
jgi:hypothetical protein